MKNSTKEDILLITGALVGLTFVGLTFESWNDWSNLEFYGKMLGLGIPNLICLTTLRKVWCKNE